MELIPNQADNRRKYGTHGHTLEIQLFPWTKKRDIDRIQQENIQ